jgi:hypothetical protein
MTASKLRNCIAVAGIVAALGGVPAEAAHAQEAGARPYDVSDAALLQSLPGFASSFAEVNGIRLHYVSGGEGDPVILLPGWPETWWAYHKIMPISPSTIGSSLSTSAAWGLPTSLPMATTRRIWPRTSSSWSGS